MCPITYDGRMARWQPGATQRLVVAAVELFTEQGYDATTVAQIAERAGVTKSTFFRHFSDKRELLVAGQETLSRLLADGIAEAPADASPLEAVAAGLERASSAMGPANRELGPRLKAAVAGYDLLVPVDQNRRVEAEGGDTTGDRPDLLAAVLARIGRIGLELHDRKESEPATLRRRCAAYRKLFLHTRFQPRICNIRHRSSLLRRRLRGGELLARSVSKNLLDSQRT